MAKVGDIVRFLNSVGGGRIVRIKDNMAYVEDEDGFETPVLIRECVVVGNVADSKPAPRQAEVAVVTPKVSAPSVETSKSVAPQVEEEDLPVVETPEGEKLNLVLAFEPKDIEQLSSTVFDTYLVNDSNYFLYFSYLTRAKEREEWHTRYAGIVEPNIQLFLGETVREDLPEMDRIAIQYIAFKRDRSFTLKAPRIIEYSLDTTRFAKLHAFKENVYFDNEVIAIDLVTNDAPYRHVVVDPEKLNKAMNKKKAADQAVPRRRIVKKKAKTERNGDKIVVDLHITSLIDDIRGLSNADMLNLQVDEFSRVMDENLKNKGQKIIFIHGKGEGVLRNAILKELNHRYKGHDVQDASFREYGFGATQVTIR